MGFLFGDEPSVSQQNLLTPEQSDTFVKMMNILKNQVGQGVPSYPGTYTPPATRNQQEIFDIVGQLLGGSAPLQQEGMAAYSELMQPYDKTAATDYWTEAVKKPGLETWEDDIVPKILEQFAAYDAAGSGSARISVGESGKDLATNLNAILADTMFKDRTAWQNRELDAATKSLAYPPTLLSSVMGPAGEQRNIQGQQGMEAYQDWLYEQPYNNPWLKFLMPMLQQRTFENVVMPGSQGIFGDLLGAGAKIGSAMIGAGWF